MPSADTGPESEVMKPTLRSAASSGAERAMPATSAPRRNRNLFFVIVFVIEIVCGSSSGDQLPLALFQLHHHARALVGAVAVVRLEVVDAVRAHQLLGVDDRIPQCDAELR